ncbi:MAG: hypothetical protein ACREJB_12185 [Planctomycetaceae bacterium]
MGGASESTWILIRRFKRHPWPVLTIMLIAILLAGLFYYYGT